MRSSMEICGVDMVVIPAYQPPDTLHMVSHARVTDAQTGLRAFVYSLLDCMMQTKGSGYEYEMNVLLNAPRNGVPIVEVPIQTLYLDESNSSSRYHPLLNAGLRRGAAGDGAGIAKWPCVQRAQ